MQKCGSYNVKNRTVGKSYNKFELKHMLTLFASETKINNSWGIQFPILRSYLQIESEIHPPRDV